MNLSVQVNGISFNTPIILASGYITETPSFFMEAIPHGCSAIVTRSLKKIVPDERKRVPVPRYAIIPGEDSMLNCEWGNEFGWDNWRDQWVRQVKEDRKSVV